MDSQNESFWIQGVNFETTFPQNRIYSFLGVIPLGLSVHDCFLVLENYETTVNFWYDYTTYFVLI